MKQYTNKLIAGAIRGGIYAAFVPLVASQLELPAWASAVIIGFGVGLLIFMLEKK